MNRTIVRSILTVALTLALGSSTLSLAGEPGAHKKTKHQKSSTQKGNSEAKGQATERASIPSGNSNTKGGNH